MTRRRRRVSTRTAISRFKMWDAKLNPDVVAEHLRNVKAKAREYVMSYQATHEYLIATVKEIIARYGKDYGILQEYMWYAEKMWRLVMQYKREALQREADALYLWYRARGRDDTLLREIAHALGVRISPILEILERVGVKIEVKPVMTVSTYKFESGIYTVTETTKALKAEALTDGQFLDPETVKVYAKNPSGSGVTLYIELSLAYDDGSESVFRSLSVSEGIEDTYTFLSEDIYENVQDDKQIVGVRLYSYVSASPISGYEPNIKLSVYGVEFGG